jgi:hypothetical protein
MPDALVQFIAWSLIFDHARIQLAQVVDIACEVAVAPKGVFGDWNPFAGSRA